MLSHPVALLLIFISRFVNLELYLDGNLLFTEHAAVTSGIVLLALNANIKWRKHGNFAYAG